jgi:hypothetical protein
MWRIQFCIFGRPNARTVAELVTYPPVPRVPSPHLEFDLSLSAASRSPPSARPPHVSPVAHHRPVRNVIFKIGKPIQSAS